MIYSISCIHLNYYTDTMVLGLRRLSVRRQAGSLGGRAHIYIYIYIYSWAFRDVAFQDSSNFKPRLLKRRIPELPS